MRQFGWSEWWRKHTTPVARTCREEKSKGERVCLPSAGSMSRIRYTGVARPALGLLAGDISSFVLQVDIK